MFIVLRAPHGDFTEAIEVVGTFHCIGDAEDAMSEDAWRYATEHDAFEDDVHNGVHPNGMPWMYVDSCECAEWQVVETEGKEE